MLDAALAPSAHLCVRGDVRFVSGRPALIWRVAAGRMTALPIRERNVPPHRLDVPITITERSLLDVPGRTLMVSIRQAESVTAAVVGHRCGEVGPALMARVAIAIRREAEARRVEASTRRYTDEATPCVRF